MTSQLASGDLISDRYASALYELASERKVVDLILENLNNLKNAIESNKDLIMLVKSPLISSNDKLQILLKLTTSFQLNDLSITFLKVLSNNKRFANLTSIITQFKKINANRRGDLLADVTSADELTEEQKMNIKNQLQVILGDKLSLDFKEDKKIIGGLVIKVGSKMIDSSLSSRINKLKIAMKGA
jgi:F-type H+-transporting ATPase subunit delta